MTLARWSGDAYLLTSQKLLQDQYEREFGADLALVKGRDNYLCERYQGAPVPTSRGLCRRVRGPACGCPYVRAKQAALNAPIFCTNTAYFATLRHWHAEQLRTPPPARSSTRRTTSSASSSASSPSASRTRRCGRGSAARCRGWRRPTTIARSWASTSSDWRDGWPDRPGAGGASGRPSFQPDLFLEMPPTREEQVLLEQRDVLETALARLTFFLDAGDREWIVRYPDTPGAALALVPLSVGAMARELLGRMRGGDRAVLRLPRPPRGAGRVLRSRRVRLRRFTAASPFLLEQRPIVYRPVGALSQATLARLEPALFAEVAAILAAHPGDKGLIHVASYGAGRRLVHDLPIRAPREARRLSGSTPPTARPQRSSTTAPRRCRRCWSRPRCGRVSTFPTTSCASRSSPSCPSPTSAIRGRRRGSSAIPAGTRPRRPRPCCRRTADRAATPTTTA